MIFAISITTLSLPLLAASVAGIGSIAATNIARSHRNTQRIEKELDIYDRAFEIYSRLPATAEARSQLMVSEELILLAALHSCGGIDDEGYRRAKARVTSFSITDGAPELVGSLEDEPATEPRDLVLDRTAGAGPVGHHR